MSFWEGGAEIMLVVLDPCLFILKLRVKLESPYLNRKLSFQEGVVEEQLNH
jgi:hypothetical protein